MLKYLAAAALASVLTVSATARPTDPQAAKADPNKVICRSEKETGSRLASVKRCMTAQEWANQRFEDRQSIEKRQVGGLNRP